MPEEGLRAEEEGRVLQRNKWRKVMWPKKGFIRSTIMLWAGLLLAQFPFFKPFACLHRRLHNLYILDKNHQRLGWGVVGIFGPWRGECLISWIDVCWKTSVLLLLGIVSSEFIRVWAVSLWFVMAQLQSPGTTSRGVICTRLPTLTWCL